MPSASPTILIIEPTSAVSLILIVPFVKEHKSEPTSTLKLTF